MRIRCRSVSAPTVTHAYGIMPIDFTVTDLQDPSRTVTEDSRFLGPTP